MTKAVVTQLPGVDGRYVLGMTWRHEETRPKARRLRELAEQHGTWGLVRRTPEGAVQIAFCAPVDGCTARQVRSLADAIAEAHVAPWRGMYALGQGQYWYVAVGAGHEMLPDGDRVGTAEELQALRQEHNALASWSEQEGTVSDLARHVAGINTASLREIAPSIVRMPRLSRQATIAAGATALVVLGACGVWYHSHLAALEEQQRDAMQRRAQALAALAQRPVQKEPPPWAQAISAAETFGACRSAWSGQALATRGWTLRAWSCAGTAAGLAVHTRWGRETGDAMDAPGVIDQTGEYAVNAEHIELTWKPRQRTLADLAPSSESKRRGWALSQRYGVGLALDKKDADGTKLPGDEADHPEWQRHRLIYTLPMAPWFGFGSAFDALGGLQVRSITADLSADTWVVDALLYAQPDAKVQK